MVISTAHADQLYHLLSTNQILAEKDDFYHNKRAKFHTCDMNNLPALMFSFFPASNTCMLQKSSSGSFVKFSKSWPLFRNSCLWRRFLSLGEERQFLSISTAMFMLISWLFGGKGRSYLPKKSKKK